MSIAMLVCWRVDVFPEAWALLKVRVVFSFWVFLFDTGSLYDSGQALKAWWDVNHAVKVHVDITRVSQENETWKADAVFLGDEKSS